MPSFVTDLSTRPRAAPAGAVAAVVILVVGIVAVLAGGGDSEAARGPATTTTVTDGAPPPAPPDDGPRAPLTGLPVDDPASLAHPALVVKIDNADGVTVARPQTGIDQADVVYEEEVEGSVTRFAAVFHSTSPGKVGPVRSARTTDVDLTANLARPLFAWSGANGGTVAALREADLIDIGVDAASSDYARIDRPAPHNLYSDTGALFARAPEGAGAPAPLFQYRPDGAPLPAGAEPVTSVNVNFGDGPGSAPVDWTWDGAGWARSQRGTPHVLDGGVQLAPENVVLLFVGYAPSPADARSPEAETLGQGEAWVLTQGHLIRGRWNRPTADAPWNLTDASGAPLLLTPGHTWVPLPRSPDRVTVR
ncbi:DUF3048 domain-containing protein [soil metagenome]